MHHTPTPREIVCPARKLNEVQRGNGSPIVNEDELKSKLAPLDCFAHQRLLHLNHIISPFDKLQ